MKRFKIYENPAQNYEAVKIGWSWPAFFFSGIWALFKKLWVIGGITITFFILLFVIISSIENSIIIDHIKNLNVMDLDGVINSFARDYEEIPQLLIFDVIDFSISLLISFFFGIFGNRWREKNLSSRGYEFKNIIDANDPEGAVAIYMKNKQKERENRISFKKTDASYDDRRWAPPGYFENNK